MPASSSHRKSSGWLSSSDAYSVISTRSRQPTSTILCWSWCNDAEAQPRLADLRDNRRLPPMAGISPQRRRSYLKTGMRVASSGEQEVQDGPTEERAEAVAADLADAGCAVGRG